MRDLTCHTHALHCLAMNDRNQQVAQVIEGEWVSFPGGELEGKRPKALCSACREQQRRRSVLDTREHHGASASASGGGAPRAVRNVNRERALKAAGQLDTASPERFQAALPFEPVNRPRLAALKAERVAARATLREGAERFEARRRLAQIAARHALQRIEAALEARQVEPAMAKRIMASAVHADELQLPESWLPFVVAREA